MKLTEFEHIKYKVEVNKKQIPIVEIPYSNYQVWNDLYAYAKKHFVKVDPLPSGAFPNGAYKGYFRYMIYHVNQSHELVICCSHGCYRFIIQPSKQVTNTVSGRQSVLELYKVMDEYGIDFGKYACSDGKKVKETIVKPHIQLMKQDLLRKRIHHCYHLDLNSSYASRVAEAYPELKPILEELYAKRKEDNNHFKHVLTNSIGCFQSQYCPSWEERRKVKPYAFANLSKIAVNGTREKVDYYCKKLVETGMIPLLSNIDGIWYYSSKGAYHDETEGTSLCQYKNDHCDCDLLIASVGSYQYIEDGKCHTCMRGSSALDQVKNREDWEFGDILNANGKLNYSFDEEKGIVENYA